ncbi:MAG: erythromycin esterase family protein [Sphingobacteriales bacterium]
MPNLRLYLTAFFITISVGCALAQDTKILDDIKAHAVPISTDPDDTVTFSDMQPLKQILSNRRIVGMGEATHGSHEFFAMKHRMLEFLVKQMGFRVFAIEANFTECRAVNDYVLYGKGDAKKVIAGMYFWTWNTTEVLKMVEWMRHYNMGKSTAGQVKFYGFDMQVDGVARLMVRSKLIKLDSGYYVAHFKAFDTLKIRPGGFTKFSGVQIDSIKSLLKNIHEYIIEQDTNLLKIYTRNEVDYLSRDLRLLEQCLEESGGTGEKFVKMKGSYARDRCMAENVEWILDHEGANSKMMIWAHNGHINKTAKFLGGYLKDSLKDAYYAIGFDFNKGGFRSVDLKAKKLKDFVIGDAVKGSTGDVFSQLNIPAFFIDIEGIEKSNSPATSFMNKEITSRTVGAVFDPAHEDWYYQKDKPYSRFDGLIFVNEVTASTGL